MRSYIYILIFSLALTGATKAQQVELVVQKGHTAPVLSLGLSDDDKFLCSISSDKEMIVWDVESGNILVTGKIPLEKKELSHADSIKITFSKDLKTIYTGVSGHCNYYNVENKLWTKDTITRMSRNKRFVSGSTNKEQVYIKSNKEFKLFRYAGSKKLFTRTCKYFENEFMAVATDKNYKKIIASCSDNKIYIYDYTTGKKLAVLRRHTGAVNDVVVSNNNKFFFTCSSDRGIVMWDMEKLIPVKIFFKELAAKTKISGDKDNTVLFIANEQGEVYRMQTGNKTFDVKYKKFHQDKIQTLEALSSSTFFSGADDGKLKISNFNTGKSGFERKIKHIYHPYYFLYLMVSKNYHRDVLRTTEYSLLKDGIIGVKTLWQPNPFSGSLFKNEIIYLDTTGKKITKGVNLYALKHAVNFKISSAILTSDTLLHEYLQQFTSTHHTIVGNTTQGYAFSICNDGLVYVWEALSGKLLAKILLEKDNKVIFLPDQYYMSSAKSLKSIGYRKGTTFLFTGAV